MPSKTVSYSTFEKVFLAAGFKKLVPEVDLRMLVLFLAEASGKHADGQLTQSEWSLLKGLNSKALVGSPARLRKLLLDKYGGIDQAFQHIHTSWLQRALAKGLKQLALAGMARVLSEQPEISSARSRGTQRL